MLDLCLNLTDSNKSDLSNLMSKVKVILSSLPKKYLHKEIYQHRSEIWELMETEQNFLKQIHFFVQIYVYGFEMLCLKYFSKVKSEEIFSNFKELCRVLREFWKYYIQPAIENYEKTRKMIKPRLLKKEFLTIGEIQQPNVLYCTEILTLRKSNKLAEYIKNIGGRSVENYERLTFNNINEDKDILFGNKSKELCEKLVNILYAQSQITVCDQEFMIKPILRTINIGGTSVEDCERLTRSYICELEEIYNNINEDKDFPIGNKSKELCEKFGKLAMIMYAQPRNHLQHCKSSFLNGEKESNLQLVYKMSCKFIKVGCVQEEYYENAIAHYSMINMIIFEDEFIKILRETVTHQTPLEDNEKTILNIVCNTFTICGQFHASPALAPRIGDIFATIMEYLEILQPIASGNMIASRISEIILYCLCNIAQKGKLNDKRGWRPILYEYYIGSKHSTEIKIASAVSISLLLTNAESKEKYKIEMEKIKEYLNDITREIIIDNRCDYFGFTQDEIEEALAGH